MTTLTLNQVVKMAAERGGAFVHFSRMFNDWQILSSDRNVKDDELTFKVLADGTVLSKGNVVRIGQ
jgi:hypothetical protein